MAAAWELARYKLYFMGVQNVRGDKEDKVRQADFNFCTSQNSVSSYEGLVCYHYGVIHSSGMSLV
jgi:hypothetical protein